MQKYSFDYFSCLCSASNTLLKNCGFSPDFFSTISQNIFLFGKNNENFKKIRSENDMISLQMKRRRENFERKKTYEAEDKDFFKKMYENNLTFSNASQNNSFNSLYDFSAFTTIPSQECLDKINKKSCEKIKNNNNNYLIKAYRSKLKKKYSRLYEINSINLEEKNKFKLFHKCCYPGCNRTFSSSGWLKAHLDKHLKKIHHGKYSKMFETILLDKQIENMQKEEN